MRQKTDIKDELTQYWNSFLAGDDSAFSKIYEKLIQDLFSFGTTFTTNTELVKDCIQDIFVWLIKNKANLASVDNIKVYLLIALRNALFNAFKKQQVYQKFMDAYSVEEQMEPLDDSEEERIIARETDMTVHDTLEKYKSALTVRQQEIIHYRFVDNLKIEEISKILNINYQSVANVIQQSLKRIRNFLSENGYKT